MKLINALKDEDVKGQRRLPTIPVMNPLVIIRLMYQ
ncbi:MAG: hypothetical protein QG610_2092 [Euryarchaeota archaeon]|nr:hypothetical protein [Euryarchaeota archaeon]